MRSRSGPGDADRAGRRVERRGSGRRRGARRAARSRIVQPARSSNSTAHVGRRVALAVLGDARAAASGGRQRTVASAPRSPAHAPSARAPSAEQHLRAGTCPAARPTPPAGDSATTERAAAAAGQLQRDPAAQRVAGDVRGASMPELVELVADVVDERVDRRRPAVGPRRAALVAGQRRARRPRGASSSAGSTGRHARQDDVDAVQQHQRRSPRPPRCRRALTRATHGPAEPGFSASTSANPSARQSANRSQVGDRGGVEVRADAARRRRG